MITKKMKDGRDLIIRRSKKKKRIHMKNVSALNPLTGQIEHDTEIYMSFDETASDSDVLRGAEDAMDKTKFIAAEFIKRKDVK